MEFQVSFTPLPGCFSPFPHGTGYAIGRQLVFSLGGWSPLIHTGFLESRATRDHSQLSSCISPTGLSPSPVRFPTLFGYTEQIRRSQPSCVPQPRAFARFRLLPFRSPLLRESRLISSPPGTEMFHFPGSRAHFGRLAFTPAGFPHSGISGSTLACNSPELFAACHALLRHLPPRHPLHALLSFTFHRMHFSMTFPHWWRQGDSNP